MALSKLHSSHQMDFFKDLQQVYRVMLNYAGEALEAGDGYTPRRATAASAALRNDWAVTIDRVIKVLLSAYCVV